MLHVAVTYWR